jgi:hypothetical protein
MGRFDVAKELWAIRSALNSHDPGFTVPMYRAVIRRLARYFDTEESMRTLLWSLRRFRNEAMRHDAKEAGE